MTPEHFEIGGQVRVGLPATWLYDIVFTIVDWYDHKCSDDEWGKDPHGHPEYNGNWISDGGVHKLYKLDKIQIAFYGWELERV